MVWLILTLGSIIVIADLAIMALPKLFRLAIDLLAIGSRLYLVGIVRIIAGIMLLILAPQARLWWYVVIFGLICTASGCSIFFLPLRRTKKLFSRLQHQSHLAIRLWTALSLLLWIFLFYALTAAVTIYGLH
ncbi:MAG: hypothetical protein V1727_06475 [Candidatus Omnitrophota bacterium]